MTGDRINVVVERVEPVCDGVRSFYLVSEAGAPLPGFAAGAHVALDLEGPDRRWRNAYSLTGPPGDTSHYRITVLRKPNGRGGSRFLHDEVRRGHRLALRGPTNWFGLNHLARKSVLIAGGIGITPIIAMARELREAGRPMELHYAVRSLRAAAFATELQRDFANTATIHSGEDTQRLAISSVLAGQPLGTRVYVCGPESLIEDVRGTARLLGWPPSAIQFEKFATASSGAPFEVRLRRSHQQVSVPADFSLLEAIERAGIAIDSLCRVGACGRCQLDVLHCDGELIHRDIVLTAEEKASGTRLLSCVSRFSGRRLVLDL